MVIVVLVMDIIPSKLGVINPSFLLPPLPPSSSSSSSLLDKDLYQAVCPTVRVMHAKTGVVMGMEVRAMARVRVRT